MLCHSDICYEEEPSKQYLSNLFHSVWLKDIGKRNKIREVDRLEGIIAYVMASTGIAFSDIIVTMDEMDMSRNGIKHRTI
ncbi:MAG TPA: hypothetical protein H9733_03155 [Candidatus Anaerotignum merdipullorum]|nr:hypothetical protein [Candidatus Anaerotignum merdipullorum]